MILPGPPAAVDWSAIRLVVFDVDGTLYRQRPLRLRMAAALLLQALRPRGLATIRALACYRRLREPMGDAETADFGRILLAETAAATGLSEQAIRAIVAEWIDRRPLPFLAGCRYPGLVALFAGLRRTGKVIGVLSDYPATAKLAALGLSADHIVSAEDEGIGRLKPNPKGLESLIRRAGAAPAATMMIGDRVDRDGMVARRAGTQVLIRSSRPIEGWQTFDRFDAPVFRPLVAP
ncbi:phosphoglycolate phosphatase [soil metagenome]